jgi:putative FmdB family regulatory protein
MPVYEYRCLDCGESFDILVRGSTNILCPHCGSSLLTKLLSAPFVSSGRTARPAGRTCCDREERCSAPPCSDGGTCRRD